MLVEAVYAAADDQGAANVFWMTDQHDNPARILYDRVGHVTTLIKYERGKAGE